MAETHDGGLDSKSTLVNGTTVTIHFPKDRVCES
jgi:hypothetical protein